MTKAKNKVQSTERTLRIIDTIHNLDGARVTELARELEMSKATIHHHLSTLEEHEYVTKEGNVYHLGMRLFELGEYTRRRTGLYNIAKPEIDSLAEETGEMANLMIEEHGRGVYIYIARGDQAVHLDTQIGTRQYLHTSALGKAILAHMTEERFEEVIRRHGLPEETPNTVTDEQELRKELETIREQGVAFDGEERAEGIRCVASHIEDNRGFLVGAVSVSGPSSRMKGARFKEKIPELVQNAATVIGINVTYS